MKTKIITIIQKAIFIGSAVFIMFAVLGSLSFLLTTSRQTYTQYMIEYGTFAGYAILFISVIFIILTAMNLGFIKLWKRFFSK